MQIVIEIPEEVYKERGNQSFTNKATLEILHAVRNGVPIYKGHGRLGDLDELEARIDGFVNNDKNYIDDKVLIREIFILDGIKATPTVIEADKGED